MTLPDRRLINLGGFVACAGLMGFALYAQHVLLLDPCPLCILQRIAVIVLGATFVVAALHNPSAWWGWAYAILVGLVAAAGTGIAAWHVRMQNLPPSEVPACGPGLDYMIDNFPFAEAMRMVFRGSGECADVVWSFLGLSMPSWVVICVASLGVLGVWNNLRKQ